MASLPEPLPDEPVSLLGRWLEEAAALDLRNPCALALATTSSDGLPAVRFVLLKALDATEGFIVFYTNYASRKAAELDGSGRAAGAMYWEALGRQLRFEGAVTRSPAVESDAYFALRPRGSQLNAWASKQSRPLADPADLDRELERLRELLGTDVERPPFWGGYRLWLDAIEFWCEGRDRFHERVRYTRELGAGRATVAGGDWRRQRLQP